MSSKSSNKSNIIHLKKAAFNFYKRKEYIERSSQNARSEIERRKELLSKYLPHNKRQILEIGCGTGVLQNIHPSYIGLDISDVALKELEKPVIQASVEKMPFRNGCIDVLFSFNTLEHVFDVKSALLEVDRILSPEGIVILREAWGSGGAKQNGTFNFLRRALKIGVNRIVDWIKFRLRKKIEIRSSRLEPDYSTLKSDADAVSCIDSYNLYLWFLQQGYSCINENLNTKRSIFKKDPFEDRMLVVKKNRDRSFLEQLIL